MFTVIAKVEKLFHYKRTICYEVLLLLFHTPILYSFDLVLNLIHIPSQYNLAPISASESATTLVSI